MSARSCAVAVWLALAAAPAELRAQEGPPRWSFAASAFGYFLPDEDDVAVTAVQADRGPLHLEGRYNYEARGAGSLFVGWTFSLGDAVAVDLTPMLGGVFGDLSGIAPGVELDLTYERLNFYFEGEYVRDLDDEAGNFVYGWSELTYAPTDWFRAGLVGQRTRLHDTGLDVQRGLMLGFTFLRLDLGAYFFNPGSDDAFEVVSLSVEF